MTHPTPKTEIVAKVMLFNANGEALILKNGDNVVNPNKSFRPDLPGGVVDSGESSRQAVARELAEETGVILDEAAFELVFARTEYRKSRNESITKELYFARCDNVPKIVLSYEHESYYWASFDDFKAGIDLTSFYVEAIRYLIDHKILLG